MAAVYSAFLDGRRLVRDRTPLARLKRELASTPLPQRERRLVTTWLSGLGWAFLKGERGNLPLGREFMEEALRLAQLEDPRDTLLIAWMESHLPSPANPIVVVSTTSPLKLSIATSTTSVSTDSGPNSITTTVPPAVDTLITSSDEDGVAGMNARWAVTGPVALPPPPPAPPPPQAAVAKTTTRQRSPATERTYVCRRWTTLNGSRTGFTRRSLRVFWRP